MFLIFLQQKVFVFFYFLFVSQDAFLVFFKCTNKSDIAAGVTPGSLDALAIVCGLASDSFCFTSLDKPTTFIKSMEFGMVVFSDFCSLSISCFCLFMYPVYFISASIWSIAVLFFSLPSIGRSL